MSGHPELAAYLGGVLALGGVGALASRNFEVIAKWRTWAVAAVLVMACLWQGAPGAALLAAGLGVAGAVEYGRLAGLRSADIAEDPITLRGEEARQVADGEVKRRVAWPAFLTAGMAGVLALLAIGGGTIATAGGENASEYFLTAISLGVGAIASTVYGAWRCFKN